MGELVFAFFFGGFTGFFFGAVIGIYFSNKRAREFINNAVKKMTTPKKPS